MRFATRGNFPLLFLFIAFTSYIIPQYLTTVQGYRREVGGVLVWIALPQFVLAPFTARMLRFIDPRFLTAVGFLPSSASPVSWRLSSPSRRSASRSG
jgi:MFS transporter, DHA2 family, multidrug resistance protein